MHFKLLSDRDLKAIDALIADFGGGKAICERIKQLRQYETRKKMAAEKGYGEMLKKAERYARDFPKVEDFVDREGIRVTRPGVCTTQVSGFQGSRVTLDCMRRVAENRDVLFPTEMISVVALTEHYVYTGDLLATLAMAENVIKASKFCSQRRYSRPPQTTGWAQLLPPPPLGTRNRPTNCRPPNGDCSLRS